MLREAGLNSNPVIISTKENAIPFFPTVDRLNYVVAYAEVNDKPYFLDATEEFSDINVLPVKDYNWRGILINNEEMVWEQIDILSPGKSNKLFSVNMTVHDDGSCEGNYQSRMDKHSALSFRKKIKNEDMDAYLTAVENQFSGIEISDYQIKNGDIYEGPVSESFTFYDEYGAEEIDGKLFVNPMAFMQMEENPFKLEERTYPIDYGYPFKNTYMLNITMPEGYKVESKPEPILMRLPENLGAFKYNLKEGNGTINVLVNFEINRSRLSEDVYPYLREFYKQVIAKESERIVLTKV